MKTTFITIGLCFVVISMPLGVSDCGCPSIDESTTSDEQKQPWISDADLTVLQQQAQDEGWTFSVGRNPATQRPLSDLCGFVVPDRWWTNASFDPCIPTSTLPPSFDWRELGGCTPIKDQDGCGSCWAFGTIAPLECNILIKDKKEVDLSEQWLVSCNQIGWGCNGGWWAHDYHQWKTDCYNGTGAVLEEDFPYEALDLPCSNPYPHPYRIDSWKYIGYHQGTTKVEAIKQAIMTYGPVSVGVAVTHAFGAYTGGIFNEDDPNATINHAVALVGWDDSQGAEGVWILRNSWGSWWGEEGYMRIEYGVCKVGYGASYIVYPAKTHIDITGGLFGVTVGVRNTANTTTTELQWTIVLTGGVYGAINITMQNTLETLEPGTVFTQRIPRLGFGHLSISVTVLPKNAGKVTKHAEGFLCGLLVFVSQKQ
jgi:C1A family cysteine protease